MNIVPTDHVVDSRVKNLALCYVCLSKSQYMDIVSIYHVDDSRVVWSIYVHEYCISIVDNALLGHGTSILVEDVHIPYVNTCDIVDELVKFNIHAPTEIHIHEENTNDVQNALVEFCDPT